MISISKNVYIEKLDDIVSNYNYTYYCTTKMEPAYVITDLKGAEIFGKSYKSEFQKANQKELRIEIVIKRNRDKLYAKWKGYNNSFNSWIVKKYIV